MCFVNLPLPGVLGAAALADVEPGSVVQVELSAGADVPQQRWLPGDEWHVRLVLLWLPKGEGDWVRCKLLREANGREATAGAGGQVWLELPEMGARGWTQVLAVEPCPRLPAPVPGYRLVTGTFHHSRAVVYDLKIEGEPKPLAGTAQHPIRSADRVDWVPLVELCEGERVVVLEGTAAVESVTLREREEEVYNVEVDGEHVYRVGERGLLVHNASVPCKVEQLTKSHLKPSAAFALSGDEEEFRDQILARATHLAIYRAKPGDGCGDFVLVHLGNSAKLVAIAVELKNQSAATDFTITDGGKQIFPSQLCTLGQSLGLALVGTAGITIQAPPRFRSISWDDLLKQLNDRFQAIRT
jgi:hypothetical protein